MAIDVNSNLQLVLFAVWRDSNTGGHEIQNVVGDKAQ